MDTQKELADYLVCALWSTSNTDDRDKGEFLDEDYDISDFSTEALEQAARDVASFMGDATKYLSNDDANQVPGHDFWLTRNGHGAGFWDGEATMRKFLNTVIPKATLANVAFGMKTIHIFAFGE